MGKAGGGGGRGPRTRIQQWRGEGWASGPLLRKVPKDWPVGGMWKARERIEATSAPSTLAGCGRRPRRTGAGLGVRGRGGGWL